MPSPPPSNMPHFYCPHRNITPDGRFILPPDESRHLAVVLRIKKGDAISIFDGKGNSFRAVVTDIEYMDKKSYAGEVMVSGRITDKNCAASKDLSSYEQPGKFFRRAYTDENVEINFYQAIPKKQKIEDIIDKLSQLGISSVTPVITARTIVKISQPSERAAKLKRWRAVALASSKQSLRSDIMQVKEILTFEEAVRLLKDAEHNFPTIIAWEGEKDKNLSVTIKEIKSIFKRHQQTFALNVFIGPEGGFDFHKEIEYARANLKDIFTVGLGDNILRADTAAIMLASVLVYEFNLEGSGI